MSNVVFLDYDGVVNTPIWTEDGSKCRFGFPSDNKVNNFQAVQWVSEFCQKFGYDIVVSSTWRLGENYKECLINGGLRSGINILGRTCSLRDKCRGDEIKQYLDEHPEITNFLIFDDDNDMGDLMEHLVRCNPSYGFGEDEFILARTKHEVFQTMVEEDKAMINNFTGEYFFLSNFYNAYLMYEGIIYCSTEAAFQAAKTLDVKEREKIARMSPSDAKAAGRRLELRSDWEEVKDKVMYDVCRAKFTMNDSLGLREKLLATGDAELIEGNTWHDNYWGDCSCDKCKDKVGRNQLGKTLMMLRAELRKGTE